MIAAEQRDGDAGKTVVVGKTIVVTIAITEYFVDSDHARERTRNGHRHHDLFANRNAAVLSRGRIASGRAYFVAPLRAPEKQVDQQTTEQREQKSNVEWNAFRQP